MSDDEFKFEDIKDKPEFIRVLMPPLNTIILRAVATSLTEIRNITVRQDDIWAVAYPKCGMTWTQEMIWLLMNDLNYERAKREFLEDRFPFLEYSRVIKGDKDYVSVINNSASPRMIKTHLPYELLPKGIHRINPKIIYVVRDPRDVVISFYHHKCFFSGKKLSLDNFFEDFLNQDDFEPFWIHVFAFWERRNQPNILINTFEEMKRDLPGVIRKTAQFLGRPELTDPQMRELCDHLSFSSMRANSSVNKTLGPEKARGPGNFIRKGEVGNYKEVLSEDQQRRLDEWVEKSLINSDFPYYRNSK